VGLVRLLTVLLVQLVELPLGSLALVALQVWQGVVGQHP
jgi:hypothetical protein